MCANLLMAGILLLAAFQNPMAALIGHDRVTASYPGFHKVEGDTRVLAAIGADRNRDGGGGSQDGIIIQKVGTVSEQAAKHFDVNAAIAIAPNNPMMTRFTTAAPVVYTGTATVCGHRAVAFISLNTITIPNYQAPPTTFKEINTHVVAVFGREVWHADYARLYDPAVLRTQAKALIAFTSNFCVQPNYT